MDPEPDRVAQIFEDRTILISGGTGFVGKVLIEKLLRCCNVRRIYLLIRAKKGKNPQERINDIFSNVLYNTLKEVKPDAIKKCQAVQGDVSEVNLGLSASDRKILQDEVEFIYHSAASTRFDDSLKTACIINTRGTKYMLDLAKECKKLKLFAHISTAYAFPEEKVLYEKVYKPPANPHEVLNSLNWINEESSPDITKKLLGNCPNTYTFSKALAEALVVEQMDKMPCAIVRPSLVVPVLREPLPGWVNNLQGIMGLFVGAGKGIIRTMYVNPDAHADFIPVDLVINGILLSSWYYLTIDKKNRVVHCTASSEFNYSWEYIVETGKEVCLGVMPFNGVVWYPGGSMKRSKLLHNICFYLFQIVPALFIDALLLVLGYKPILYGIQRRIQNASGMIEYYTNRTWNFSNLNSLLVKDVMNSTERQKYNIEGDGINVKNYLIDCMRTVRRVNLKESDESLPGAKRHLKIMWAVDKLFKIAFLYWVLSFLYNRVLIPILGR